MGPLRRQEQPWEKHCIDIAWAVAEGESGPRWFFLNSIKIQSPGSACLLRSTAHTSFGAREVPWFTAPPGLPTMRER